MQTKEQINEYVRNYRKRTNNIATRKYEKTKRGFLMRLYRNMQSRVTGVQKLKHHLYKGKSILPRQDFYDWSISNQNFHRLFDIWERNNYDRKLCPSVNRIDSCLGYELNNIEWITHSENSRYTKRWGIDHGKLPINIMAEL